MTVIQVGANDGRDHVLEYVSSNPGIIDRLVLIEANPRCVPILTETYRDFHFAEIHNFAVVDGNDENINLLLPAKDPTSSHASSSVEHMTKHGHRSPIPVTVPARNIMDVLLDFSDNGIVDRFYIDVEGFDVRIVNAIDFDEIRIPFLCFEYIHSDGPHSYGGANLESCRKRLTDLGYVLRTEEYNVIAEIPR